MKKSSLAIVLLLVFFVCVLVGCNDDNTKLTSLTKVGDVLLHVGEKANVDRFLVMEGEGKLSYAVENPDVLQLEGSIMTGLKEGEAAVIVSSGDFVVRINVTVSDGEKVSVIFADTTATYDGTPHNLGVSGYLPEGTQIRFYMDGEPFYGGIEAGTYEITAEVDLPVGYVLDCTKNTATLTVEKATYNLAGVNFTTRKLTYTGEEQGVTLTGTLPEGISVQYTGNRATEAGTYSARASFSGENPNYEKIPDMTCTYTISPRLYNLPANGFGNEEKTYDGKAFTLKLTDLPAGVTAKYYTENNGTYEEVAEHSYTNAGLYSCYVRLTAPERIVRNYEFTTATDDLRFTEENGAYLSGYAEATLEVYKATLECGELVLRDANGYAQETVEFGNEVVVGSVKPGAFSLMTEGKKPVGVNNEFAGLITMTYDTNEFYYNGKGQLNAGTYTVKATYVLPGEYRVNYLDPATPEFRLKVVKATYDTSSITFNAESESAYFTGEEFVFTPEGYDEEMVKVTYGYKRNGVSALSVRHAGEYEVTAKFSLKEDAANYYPLPEKKLTFTVLPRRFDVNVTFDDLTTTYDGEVKRLTVVENEPLPEHMEITYRNNASVDAGVFLSTATFRYTETYYYTGDYVIYINGRKTDTLTATLTVRKANYVSSDVDGISAQTGLTYYYGMKLYAVPFVGDDEGNVAWKNPDEEIGTLISIDETTGYYDAKATYFPERNASIVNHNAYEFTVRIVLNKRVIDLTGATVPDQFVARTAGVLPVFVDFAEGTDDAINNAEITTAVTYTTTPYATVTVSAKREGNYLLTGTTTFENVRVYAYDPNEYTYAKGTTELVKYRGAGNVVTIPSGTKTVASLAFKDTSVVSITVPESVETVAANAFYGTFSLEELTINKLTAFDGSVKKAFGASKQNDLKITVTNDDEVGEGKFTSMDYLTEVKFTMPPLSVGREAFFGCSAMTTLVFNATQLKTIGQNAFSGCAALTTLTLPSLVGETEGSNVPLTYYFGTSSQRCALRSVTLFSDTPYVLADEAFYSAKFSSLSTISLSDKLTTIGANAFKDVYADLDLSDVSLTVLGEYALAGFKGNLVLPAELAEIGASALKGVTGVTSLVVPAGVGSIGRKAFEGCTAEVVFAEGSVLTAVGEEAFYGYAGESVTLPNVLSIGDRAFKGATDLERIYLGTALTTVGERAFDGCSSLVEIEFPATLTYIGGWAFLGCSTLSSENGSVTFNALTAPTTSATDVFNTKGGNLTVVIKVGADKSSYDEYLVGCGLAGGTYTIRFKN